MSDNRAEAEQRIRDACESDDPEAAAIDAIETFGQEILGFLRTLLRDDIAAADAFALCCDGLWRGLADFDWHCSVRVWAFALARHAADRDGSLASRPPGESTPPSESAFPAEVIQQVRAAMLADSSVEAKSRMRQLREQLPLEDQTLLILRVDEQLSWHELAEVMAYDGQAPSEAALDEEATRVRERIQLAKEQLRKLAVEQGLISSRGAAEKPSE